MKTMVGTDQGVLYLGGRSDRIIGTEDTIILICGYHIYFRFISCMQNGLWAPGETVKCILIAEMGFLIVYSHHAACNGAVMQNEWFD